MKTKWLWILPCIVLVGNLISTVVYPMKAGELPSVYEFINITHTEYVYVYYNQEVATPPRTDPIPFESVDELRQYVKGVLQSHLLLQGNCVDFAKMLNEVAYDDYRNIGIYGVLEKDSGGYATHHWMNFAQVGNYIYQIEPQTGNVWMLEGWQEAKVK